MGVEVWIYGREVLWSGLRGLGGDGCVHDPAFSGAFTVYTCINTKWCTLNAHCHRCSVTQLCLTLCIPMDYSMPGFPVLHYFLKFAQLQSRVCSLKSIESVIPSNLLVLCCFLLLLPPIPPSIRVFSNESVLCCRWPKYWNFCFSINPSNEYSGLISFRIDWFDLFAVQGTLKSLLQHHSSKASILRHLAFFIVWLSSVHDYWKNHSFDYIDLCQQSNVSAFNTLSSFVIAFLPRSKHLLISWLQSLHSDFGAQENKVCHCFHCFLIYLPWSDGTRCHNLCCLNVEF